MKCTLPKKSLIQERVNHVTNMVTTYTAGSVHIDRVTPNRQILTIQYLRGLAALAVVAAHANAFMLLGQAGVDVFFVISGFIMWSITTGKQRIGLFLKNRVIRIVPLYWLSTAIMGAHQNASLISITKSMLFIPFVGENDQIWPVLVQGWTLNYEIFFYILVAVSLLFTGAYRLALLLSMIIALSSIGLIYTFGNPIMSTYTNPLLIEFCFGVVLAESRLRYNLSNVPLAVLFGVSAVGLFGLSPTDRLPGLFRFMSWGVPSAMLVASALLFEASGWVRRVAPLLVLGDASYAIYLFHTFIVKTVMSIFSGAVPALDIVAVVACASLLGITVAFFVEKPLLHFLRGGAKVTPV